MNVSALMFAMIGAVLLVTISFIAGAAWNALDARHYWLRHRFCVTCNRLRTEWETVEEPVDSEADPW